VFLLWQRTPKALIHLAFYSIFRTPHRIFHYLGNSSFV